jgi:UPF0716 protein FxsA
MFFYLLLLFTLLPLAELAILLWIGGQTAWWFPILLVIVTGAAGAALARWQGWRTFTRIQDDLRHGRMPADALVDGLLILVAGLLLVTPGVLTDCAGFALLVPLVRGILKRRAADWMRRNVKVLATGVSPQFWGNGNGHAPGHDQIFDAQVIATRVEDAE